MTTQTATTVARPYAKAAFRVALQTETLSAWANLLASLKIIVSQPKVVSLLTSPVVSLSELVTFLSELPRPAPDDRQRHFIQLLAQRRRLQAMPEVLALFEHYLQEHQRSSCAKVSSVVPLTDGQKQQLIQRLSKKFDRQITLEESLDPTLLGGFVIEVGDWVVDDSVRNKLQRLHQHLCGSA